MMLVRGAGPGGGGQARGRRGGVHQMQLLHPPPHPAHTAGGLPAHLCCRSGSSMAVTTSACSTSLRVLPCNPGLRWLAYLQAGGGAGAGRGGGRSWGGGVRLGRAHTPEAA